MAHVLIDTVGDDSRRRGTPVASLTGTARPGARRVLHIAQPAEGGVPAVVMAHARAQVDAGWDVTLACPAVITSPAHLAAPGVTHVPWSSSRMPNRSLVAEVRSLSALVDRLNPDIVHLHSAKAGLVGRLAVRGRRATVYQPHAWSFHAATGALRSAIEGWERHAARWTHQFLCVSAAERAEGEAAGVAGAYAVVPNGIDLLQFPHAVAGDRDAARQRLGLAPGPLAVCVGRLARQKGQDVLLDAWARVRADVPGARLVLVGDGPMRDELAARQVPGVDLVGASEDVASWYRAADVVVVPSRWEGMALVPLEASATGRSVVAARVAGMEESVGAGAGALVTSGHAEELSAALIPRLMFRAVADAEGAEGRRYVEARHELQLVTAAVMSLYDEVLHATARAS
jgi:glycosyltransferase involved in cell wall biosynthesis